MEIIKVEKLVKEYRFIEKKKGGIREWFKPVWKTVRAVTEVSFSVKKGEIVALIAPNGAGKSTLIKMMTGVFNADCWFCESFGA